MRYYNRWAYLCALRHISKASASQNGHCTPRQRHIPALPAALRGVQLLLHGDGVFEQAVDALEVHTAVSHVLDGTERRKPGDELEFPKALQF